MPAKEKPRYHDRPFNIRPLCLWALFVGITIAACYWSMWAAGAWVVILVIGLGILQFVRKRDEVVKFLGSSRLFFIGAIVLCLAVMLSFGITQLVYTAQKTYVGSHTITGTVENHRFRPQDQGVSYFTLGNATHNGKKVSGRVIVFVNDFDGTENAAQSGTRVVFTARLNKANATDMNINSRVKYSTSTKFENIEITGKSASLRHTVTGYSKTFFGKYLSPVNTELLFSMVFGDKSALDDELRNNFAVTGLAHVLAVSGLHVGLLIAIMVAVLKAVRLRRKYQLPVIVVVLIFYAYLCDFKFSIIRASIMFVILMSNRILLRKTDLLSSICAAAIITLLIFPNAITSVSFQLSYGCMLGIALYYRPIEKFLRRSIHPRAPLWLCKIQSFFIKGTTMYATTMIFTLPLIIKYFGFVPTYGVLSDLFFLPLMILAFQGGVIALLTWVGQPLFYPVNWFLDAVRWGTNTLASMPGAVINVTNGGYWFLFYIIAFVVLSRFVFLRPLYKNTAAGLLLGVYFIGFLV